MAPSKCERYLGRSRMPCCRTTSDYDHLRSKPAMLMQLPTTPLGMAPASPACLPCTASSHDPNQLPSPTTPAGPFSSSTPACAKDPPSASRISKHTTYLPPTSLTYDSGHELEVSIHAPASRFLRDLKDVFPGILPAQASRFLVIPTMQPTVLDMVAYGGQVDQERDELLDRFVAFAHRLAELVRTRCPGSWFDFTDPASGYPILSQPGPSLYPDVHGAQALLHYDVMNVGCCKVLLHPRWSSRVYPTTCFTTAPLPVILDCLQELGLPPVHTAHGIQDR